MISDEELKKSFILEHLEKDLVYLELKEAIKDEAGNGRQAELIYEGIMKIVNQDQNISYNFLIDLTKISATTSLSNRAREVYMELPRHQMLNKAAIVGNNLFLEVTVNLILQSMGRGQSMKWFKDKDEAKNWLALPD